MISTDVNYLFCTLFGEARGEPIESIVGVANVIRNRAYSGQKTYKEICLSPNQFSCWNELDSNLPLVTKLLSDANSQVVFIDPFVRQCYIIAKAIYQGDIRDNVKGAKHYVTVARYQIAMARRGRYDVWINKMKPVCTLGNHIFLV